MDDTEIVAMDLPRGLEAMWFADFNIIGVAPHLDLAGRERAIDRLQQSWRQSLRAPRPVDRRGNLTVVGADTTHHS